MSSEGVTDPAPLPELPTSRFAGREAFAQLLRDALAQAARQGWRELVFCDADFAGWPLHERQVVDSLHAWSHAGRSCTILATGYDTVVRQHARFVQWRRTWGHIVNARVCRQIDPINFPTVLWSPQWTVRLLDPARSAGVCGSEPDRIVQHRELLQELIRASSPGFPATTLGL